MRKLFFAASVGLGGAQLFDLDKEFESFQVKYNKQYANAAERASRFEIFRENLAKAELRNRANIAAGGTAVHGVNAFSDLKASEFRSSCRHTFPAATATEGSSLGSVGNSGLLDWRTKGAITDVENEGTCGSTWAFSIKESIESFAYTTAKHPLLKLSCQQIVSCDKVDQACCGGEPNTAFDYVVKAGGLESDEDYPYVSGNGSEPACHFSKSKVKISIKNYTMLEKGEKVLHEVLSTGPPSACLSAESWQTYTGGILTDCPGQMDHCVQVVGYDDTNKPPYWIVRNQWGTDWGEQGYIRIAQGKDLCQIADLVSHPTF